MAKSPNTHTAHSAPTAVIGSTIPTAPIAPTGVIGVTAPTAVTGLTAPTGVTALTDPTDPTNPTVPKGVTGVTTPKGVTGFTAPTGVTGFTAPTGLTAPTPVPSQLQDIEDVISLVEASAIDIAPSYDEWLTLGFALADALGEDGRSCFHRISRFHHDYTSSATDKQYNACIFSSRKISRNYLVGVAQISQFPPLFRQWRKWRKWQKWRKCFRRLCQLRQLCHFRQLRHSVGLL